MMHVLQSGVQHIHDSPWPMFATDAVAMSGQSVRFMLSYRDAEAWAWQRGAGGHGRTPVCTPAGESEQALAASERRSSSVSEAGTVAAAGASVGAAPSGGAAAACGSTAGAGGQKTPAKFDFNSLSIAELDEELANQEANFQRDVGKLRKQYERRGRALRSARASKSEGSTSSGPAVDAAEAAANAALAAAAAARR